MGYRTNGRWIITAPAEKLLAACAAMRLEIAAPPDGVTGLDEFVTFKNKGTGYMRFTFEGWKWYTSYPDVQWYESVWSWCESNSEAFGMSGKRLHIGEDNQTTEETFGDEHIELYVSVSFQDDESASGDPLTGLD